MKKIIPCFIIILMSTSKMVAQHCPFDFAALIVLNIHAENDSSVIPNLEVTMYDATGKQLTKSEYKENKWVEEPYTFWQNPYKTTFNGYIDNENPAVPEKIRFPFAKDNYVLMVARNLQVTGYEIKIEDPLGKYKTQIIKPGKKDIYSLCGTYQLEIYKDRSEAGLNYEPIDVILK